MSLFYRSTGEFIRSLSESESDLYRALSNESNLGFLDGEEFGVKGQMIFAEEFYA